MHISLISPSNWCGHQNYNSDANLSAGDNVHIWGTLPTPMGNISTVDFQEQQRMYVDRYGDVSVWASTSSLVKVGCWADQLYGYCN